MRAFVIRPFRHVGGIDFDRVHCELIGPALAATGFTGNTTQVIVESGIIHESMFLELVDADLVLADVSVHNANVFYELGIRHALRPSATVLLRSEAAAASDGVELPRAQIPFDIHGVRYFSYNPQAPGGDVGGLVTAIKDTAAARAVDSPVFRLLPDLVIDAARLHTVPNDLAEQIELHRLAGSRGDLRLLAEDVVGLRFEERALRRIAAAQTDVGDREGARRSWESVRARRPDDVQANHQLATIMARLGDRDRSDQAINRALQAATLSAYQRAELLALRGSNIKDRWRALWCAAQPGAARERAALRAAELDQARIAYTQGFRASLDNYYAGLNALALTTLQLQLADTHPDIWRSNHWDDAAADERRTQLQRLWSWLIAGVRASLDRLSDDSPGDPHADPWLASSIADYKMVANADDERVRAAYERAAEGLSAAIRASVLRQLEYCHDLGFRTELAQAIIDSVQPRIPHPESAPYLVVFSGHMIDSVKRTDAGGRRRFPAELEVPVREAIAESLAKLQQQHPSILGMAGASDGGDILFHDCCADLNIPTEVFLPVSGNEYRATVHDAPSATGATWLRRHIDVVKRTDQPRIHVLDRANGMPTWVDLRREGSPWPRTNRWILHHAFARSDQVTLLALWDGMPADGPGGVAHMVELAQRQGAEICVIDPNRLGNNTVDHNSHP